MKLRVTFKCPDAVDCAIKDAVDALDLTSDDAMDVSEDIRGKVTPWIKYGEYVTIEFDTDANTATVVKP
jgi:hypothetical protein